MGKKEFGFSVVASIVASVVLEIAGVLNISEYLSMTIQTPYWALGLIVILPIVLSLVWFRRVITPEHKKIKYEYSKLLEKNSVTEASLVECKRYAASLDVLVSSHVQKIDDLSDKLADWEERGIKQWINSDQPEPMVNQKFGPEIVELDGKEFTGCTFEGSILKFKGTGPVTLAHNSFVNVRWVIDEPASKAFGFLSSLYLSGSPEMQQLVEQTFNNVRGGSQKSK